MFSTWDRITREVLSINSHNNHIIYEFLMLLRYKSKPGKNRIYIAKKL